MVTSDLPSTTPATEAAVVLTLEATRHISREALEEATFRVERILDEHMADIAPGASACADFEHHSVEIDISLAGLPPTELHRRLATIVDTLEQRCALDVHDDTRGLLTLASSVTRVAQPHSAAA
jgi:hypothetical protein